MYNCGKSLQGILSMALLVEVVFVLSLCFLAKIRAKLLSWFMCYVNIEREKEFSSHF